MKKFEWKSVLALALTGVLALGLTACGSSDSKTADAGSAAASDGKAVYRTLDEIKESGTINIGVFSDKTRSAMWMRTVNIRAMMCIMQEDSAKTWG